MSPRGRRRLPGPWPWGKLGASRSCFKGEAVALSSLCSRQRRACDPGPADRPFRGPPPPDAALRAVAMETAAAAAPGPGWAAEGERRRRRCSRRDRDREQRRRRGPGGDAPRALLAAPRGSSSSSSPPPPARPWSSASSGERPGGPRRRRPRPRPRPPRPRARKRPAGSGSRGEEEEEEEEGGADDGEAEEEPEEEEEEEEDLIDGFAIASFASLEALQVGPRGAGDLFRGPERRVRCLEGVELRGECWHPKPEQPAPLARPLPHPGVGGGRASLQGPTRLPGLRATLVAWSPLERSELSFLHLLSFHLLLHRRMRLFSPQSDWSIG